MKHSNMPGTNEVKTTAIREHIAVGGLGNHPPYWREGLVYFNNGQEEKPFITRFHVPWHTEA